MGIALPQRDKQSGAPCPKAYVPTFVGYKESCYKLYKFNNSIQFAPLGKNTKRTTKHVFNRIF